MFFLFNLSQIGILFARVHHMKLLDIGFNALKVLV